MDIEPMSEPRRLAVIDLGSNSFRLVVFASSSDWWKRTDEIYEPVRIGEGMGVDGRLGEAPMRRALATIDVFAHFCRAAELRPGQIDAVATSAIRDAVNAEAFLTRVRERTELPIRVLTREQEAHYGYLAAVNSTSLTDGCVVDLGGGSLQLVRVDGRRARDCASWPLGAVRMTERFLPGSGPAKGRALEELRAHVRAALASATWASDAGGTLVGLGGTVRNLATAAQRAAGLPPIGVQGQTLTRTELDGLVDRLAALAPAERGAVAGIKPARADVILAGAVVLQSIVAHGGFEGLGVTEAGLREGVFLERLMAGSDPPLFADVRRASVLNLAAQYRVDPAHTDHVARLALGLFDDLAGLGLHPGDPLERELLWAACVLHDIGMSIDYGDHHKHSRYLILNAGLPGFSPREVAVIAQAARWHRKGTPDPGPLAGLFAPGDAARLGRCAVLLRLAEDLERSRDQLVRRVLVSAVGEEVQLRLLADGETIVPRWAARREADVFARAFGRTLAVVP